MEIESEIEAARAEDRAKRIPLHQKRIAKLDAVIEQAGCDVWSISAIEADEILKFERG